eukprot:SAG11_NODE_5323_length_1595_cov_355.373663_1_plen_182_part_10
MYFTNSRFFSQGNALLPTEMAARDRVRRQPTTIVRKSKKKKKSKKVKVKDSGQLVQAKRNRGNINAINISTGGGGGGGFRGGGGGSSSSSSSSAPSSSQNRGLETLLSQLINERRRPKPSPEPKPPRPVPMDVEPKPGGDDGGTPIPMDVAPPPEVQPEEPKREPRADDDDVEMVDVVTPAD